MKKTERQNGIVYLLRTRKKMTAKELASYFEVSERTIYRDIDSLCQLRVPIVSYEGLGGGYEIDASYFLPSIKLSEQEILMLLMVLKAGEELRIPNMVSDYNLLKSKMINTLSEEDRQRVDEIISHIEFSMIRIMPGAYIQDILKPIFDSFSSACDLLLSYYHPERDEIEERRFSPVELFFAEGGWYITGYCHLRQAKRTLRLDRIKSVDCLEEVNRYRDRQLPLSQRDKFRWHTYKLIIAPALYRIIKNDDYLQYTEVKTVEGGLQLTVRTPYKEDILQLVLSHPAEVTVFEPEFFLQEINQISHTICKKYLKP